MVSDSIRQHEAEIQQHRAAPLRSREAEELL